MVTEADVWAALEQVPDPEIPVVSLVDLGIVRTVAVDGGRVRVELTPTFLGCPALDAMRRALEERIVELGAEPAVEIVLDDSWSTDRISDAGREKLAAAGFAPPLRRSAGPTTLLQLERGPFRCPWCGSPETRLENVFGPTPCRSLRYCSACSQPFEAFKTI
jgi:ring-1,2-phenylacetyl-CoA epoxidase subunit PaaD